MSKLLVAGLLIVALGAVGNVAWAGGGCGGCGGCGLFSHAQFVPSVTYYAPYPYWWPQYFGPPHTDYLVTQYVTPPAESAAVVKERIIAINAGNPALLPAPTIPKEPLPYPKVNDLPPANK